MIRLITITDSDQNNHLVWGFSSLLYLSISFSFCLSPICLFRFLCLSPLNFQYVSLSLYLSVCLLSICLCFHSVSVSVSALSLSLYMSLYLISLSVDNFPLYQSSYVSLSLPSCFFNYICYLFLFTLSVFPFLFSLVYFLSLSLFLFFLN